MTHNEEKIIALIEMFGMIDGAHHKQWLLDKIVRIIQPNYDNWIKEFNEDKEHEEWDIGIAP